MKATTNTWIKPEAVEMRFGMEICAYVMNK